jgi:serine/threonine-protein kinase
MLLAPGARLGPYEILAPIGQGGMGEVYRARDSRLERDVAIKILPEHLARNPDALARFEREAKAVAALSHPNILAIHDFGREQGISYAVTELLEGETVRARVERSPLGWRRAVETAVAVADGLSAAHAKGLVHRDIKPENVFLTTDGRVKILDFGLARWRPMEGAPAAVTVTDPGTILGTTAYMSPEQVRGEDLEPASDIFSLGCVLYEMVTGQQAFARKSGAETMAAILNHEPPQLSDTGRHAPPELDRVLVHCLEKNPLERFQSARDLAFALKAVLSGSTITKTIGPPRKSKAIESLAVLPFVNETADPNTEYLSDGITDSLINHLSQLPKLRVMARSTVFRYHQQSDDPQKIGRELNVRAVLAGRVAQRGDSLIIRTELVDVTDGSRLWGEHYNRKLADLLEIEEEIAREITAKLRLRLSGKQQKKLQKRATESTEAYQLYLKGRYSWNKRTIGAIQKGIEFFEQAIAEDPHFALAHAGLADCYELLGWLAALPPREVLPKAKAAAVRALEIDVSLAEAHASLAAVLSVYDWDWPAAGRAFEKAIRLNPSYATAHHWYAVDYLAPLGRLEEAVASAERARDLEPLSLSINTTLGLILFFARRYDQAVQQCRKTLELFPKFYMAYWFLSMVYQQQSRWNEAIEAVQKAIEFSRSSPVMLAALGHAYALSGRPDEARKLLDQVTALRSSTYVSPLDEAVVHLGLNEHDAAFEALDRACDERTGRLIWMQVHPLYDPLRADPRFAGLLRRLNFS